jgi:hypothetical protein
LARWLTRASKYGKHKMIDKFFEIAASFGLSIIGAFLLLVLANIFALFAAQVFFPLKLKMKTLEWEKKRFAKEAFIEAVSRVDFMARSYINSEYDKFSFAGLTLSEIKKELLNIIRRMHAEGHKIRPYLSRREQSLFDEFVKQLSKAYDEANDSFGNWYEDDPMAEDQHSLSLIGVQAEIAHRILRSLIN